MIDRRRFTIGMAAFPTIGCAIPARPVVPPVADLSQLVAAERERAGVPALGAALVSGRGLQAIGTAGIRAWPNGPSVANGDRWHIGSCTKAFTATLAARLIERGMLRWDSTIGEVLAGDVLPGWRDVQLLWLLCHRAGMASNFDQSLLEAVVARGGALRDQRAFFVTEGLKKRPEFSPRSRTHYSNAGYIVAGAMLEKVADEPWETLIEREVFGPLGMGHSGFGAPGTPGRLDHPLGHVRQYSDGWRRIDLGPGDDNPAVGGPTGTIHASLPDWSRFIAAHLRGAGGSNDYLKSASWSKLHSPGEPGWDRSPGWVVKTNASGGRTLQHLGSNGFFVAEATLFLNRDRGVLLVTNLGDDAAEPPFRRLLETLSG